MLKRIQMVALLCIGICGIGTVAQATSYCPGQNSPTIPTNLACEIPDAASLGNVAPGGEITGTVHGIPSAIASQLEELPLATTVSGAGIVLNKSLGVFTASEASLGTILTQRGETIGKHKFIVGFTYQHFSFGTIDGINLGKFQSVQAFANGYTAADLNITLAIDEYAALASYGLTNRIDLSLVVPFSRVLLDTKGPVTTYNTEGIDTQTINVAMPGLAGGIGDVRLNLKANVLNGEHTNMALGAEMRFPSGDASNFLGSGAYGVKPYMVISRNGRFTPNLNLAYQWNGNSILDVPSSFFYSGGVDFRVNHKFTLVGEFLGQCVINGYRIAPAIGIIPGQPTPVKPNSISAYIATYAMDNLGGGFKWRPMKHLFVDASVLFKVDNAGLRATVIPLGGASYNF